MLSHTPALPQPLESAVRSTIRSTLTNAVTYHDSTYISTAQDLAGDDQSAGFACETFGETEVGQRARPRFAP